MKIHAALFGLVFACAHTLAAPAAPPAASRAAAAPSDPWLEQTTKKVKQLFPSYTFDDVRRSEIPNIAEIHSPGQIVYFAPEQNLLILGELWSANGKSLTQAKLTQMAAARISDVDMDAGLTVGTGDTEVIAFVNPDCGYCTRAEEWFEQKDFKGVRMRYFLVPSPGREIAHQKAMEAICAPADKRAEVFAKLYTRDPLPHQSEWSTCDFGEARLTTHAEIAKKVGVSATPYFLVKKSSVPGYEVITGFAPERLESLLTSNTSKE